MSVPAAEVPKKYSFIALGAVALALLVPISIFTVRSCTRTKASPPFVVNAQRAKEEGAKKGEELGRYMAESNAEIPMWRGLDALSKHWSQIALGVENNDYSTAFRVAYERGYKAVKGEPARKLLVDSKNPDRPAW